MKYMYILLCIMSSFFANKSLATDDLYTKYAFFIPTNTYQTNTYAKPINIHQQIPNPTANTKPTISKQNINNTTINKRKKDKTTTTKRFPVATKKLIPAPKKATIQTASKSKTQIKPSPTPKPQPQNKYELDDNIAQIKPIIAQTEPVIEAPKEISLQEKYQTYDIDDLLQEIPYPDSKLPTFKQIYSTYVLDLRTLRRRGTLPYNLEQDDILSKANTIRRLNVE